MQHRISKLPEPILQHILSFLHAKDVTRMSTLSKVWDSAWKSLPYLNFGDILDWSKDLNVVIDQALANRKKHKISIQKFSLCLCLGHYGGLCCVRNWIKILIACNIKELNLRVETHDYRGNFVYGSLPLAIFAAKSLNVLSLSGFSIEFPADDASPGAAGSFSILFINKNPFIVLTEFIYEDASDKVEQPCSAALPGKCWRRKLKNVELNNFTCMEQERLRNYFIASADISE
ncbi:hypothetical protein T459_17374 [Capsicum annuum]|uniref:F-box domain-containing protein n=1 Tax=Capsicum annuum TaxID=4072 RepID=A0A2G2ZBE9_CAPAN|nr:hypothetical protein T459_17374 [Capsicum annuum]